MKKLLLISIAALFLATGTAHAMQFDISKTWCARHAPKTAYASRETYYAWNAKCHTRHGTRPKWGPPPIQEKDSSEYPQLQGTWRCELPLSEGQRWQRSVDIELRKYGVHDNEYRIRGEFPVWGNDEGFTLTYTDNMNVIYFKGTPCQEVKGDQ